MRETGDVAIDDNRDRDRILDLAYSRPIRPAGIELTTGAAVDGDHADAGLLGDAGDGWRIAARFVPAKADLEGDRQINGADDRLENPSDQRLIAHQRRSRLPVDHLFDRAPHIDVDDGGTPVGVEPSRLGDRFRVATGKLNRHRELLGLGMAKLDGLCRPADHCLARYHLGNHQARAQALDQAPEREIGDAGHWRQENRRIHGHGTDINGHNLCDFQI